MEPGSIGAEPHRGDQKLPFSLVAGLPPAVRHALDHSVRRRILRALVKNRTARSSYAIATLLSPNPGIRIVGYHVRVLEQLGCLRLAKANPRVGEGAVPLYESNLVDDQEVVAILHATQELDRSND